MMPAAVVVVTVGTGMLAAVGCVETDAVVDVGCVPINQHRTITNCSHLTHVLGNLLVQLLLLSIMYSVREAIAYTTLIFTSNNNINKV